MKIDINKAYKSGIRAFKTGKSLGSCSMTVSENREAWVQGFSYAESKCTKYDSIVRNTLRTCRTHIFNNGEVYVFIRLDGKVRCRSGDKLSIKKMLSNSSFEFVGHYVRFFKTDDLIDDLMHTFELIK